MRTLCMLAICSLALGALRTAAQGDKPDYMPLKLGSKWTYHMKLDGQTYAVTQRVVKLERLGDHDVASLEMEIGAKILTELYSSSSKGVFAHTCNGVPADPPLPVLQLPFKKGNSWEGSLPLGGQKFKVTFKADEEEVTVPAGKYKTITVQMEGEIMGQKISARNWFAPNVGMVKQAGELGGNPWTSELVKIELAK